MSGVQGNIENGVRERRERGKEYKRGKNDPKPDTRPPPTPSVFFVGGDASDARARIF